MGPYSAWTFPPGDHSHPPSLAAFRLENRKKPAVDVSDQKIAEEGKEKKKGKKGRKHVGSKGGKS